MIVWGLKQSLGYICISSSWAWRSLPSFPLPRLGLFKADVVSGDSVGWSWRFHCRDPPDFGFRAKWQFPDVKVYNVQSNVNDCIRSKVRTSTDLAWLRHRGSILARPHTRKRAKNTRNAANGNQREFHHDCFTAEQRPRPATIGQRFHFGMKDISHQLKD